MARLYEHQSKMLLKEAGIGIPEGDLARSPEEVRQIAHRIGKPVVLKVQLWATGRAGLGGIQYANTSEEAEEISRHLLGMKSRNFVIDKILVEEKLNIKSEFFAGLIIDDLKKCPLLLFSSVAGTGIEEITHSEPGKVGRIYIDIWKGLIEEEAHHLLEKLGISGKLLLQLSGILTKLYEVARKYEARFLEINPLVLTEDDLIYAADCHLAIDDNAIFRHPELNIGIAREFDRPPSALEKIAYHIEEIDNRGTFYFLQMAEEISKDETFIGFHGAGGGGSMMSMDAILAKGFKPANYCDTSGNPPASKVYRAAKIILSQPNIKGYFASGSGVVSQEQFHSARGFVKAFNEEKIRIPAVIHLGGNYEERAMEILGACLKNIPATIEAYGRDDSPEICTERLKQLIQKNKERSHEIQPIQEPSLPPDSYSFETFTGKIFIDHIRCANCETKGCLGACTEEILKLENDKPVLAVLPEDARKGKCTECLACEIYCASVEQDAILIHLPIPGLKEYREKMIMEQKQ